MTEDKGGTGRTGIIPENLLWPLVYLALGAGGVSGLSIATDERERPQEHETIQVELDYLKEGIRDLREQVRRFDDSHPPPALIQQIEDHEVRLRALERP